MNIDLICNPVGLTVLLGYRSISNPPFSQAKAHHDYGE